MPSFIPIKSIDNIKLDGRWTDCPDFKSKNREVDHLGYTYSYGHGYRIIAKKERNFSSLERVGRCFLGILASLLVLPLLSKKIRKLFTEQKKSIRFGIRLPPSAEKKPPTPVDFANYWFQNHHSILCPSYRPGGRNEKWGFCPHCPLGSRNELEA